MRAGTARQERARVYSVSATGAFLATSHPAPRDAMLDVRMRLPWGEADVKGTVVMTNAPGDLMVRNLPVGMAVRFDQTAPETKAALVMYAEERLRTLGV